MSYPPQPSYPPMPPPLPSSPMRSPDLRPGNRGLAIAAVVLGGVALLLSFIPGLGILFAWLPGLLALIFGLVSGIPKTQSRSLGLSGAMLAILSGFVSIVLLLVLSLAAAKSGNAVQETNPLAVPSDSTSSSPVSNTVAVPNVVGMTGTEAKSTLEEAGLTVMWDDDSLDPDTWMVTSTSPAAGESVDPGYTVLAEVSDPSTGGSSVDSTDSNPSVPASNAPKGYTYFNDDVYIKWGGTTSDDFSATNYLYVYAPNGCSSLYVEANILDDSGTIVDYTNDVASNIPAGGKAKLSLTTVDDDSDASKIEVTEADCY